MSRPTPQTSLSSMGAEDEKPAVVNESSTFEPSLHSSDELRATSRSALKLYLVLAVPSMAAICVGYDISVMNFVNGLGQYLTYFHIGGQSAGGVGSETGLIFAMYTLGTCVAVLFAGPLADRFGRRAAMFSGGLFCVVGTIIVTFAQNTGYLKGGRFLLGISTALLQVGAPMYVVELSPPKWRGRMSGIYAAIAIVSTIISGGITTAAAQWASSVSWRLPFALQLVPAVGVSLFSYLIPESPRWLMSVGRKDDARKVLYEYHGNGAENSALVVLEVQELEQAITTDATKKPWWDYASLFQTRSNRNRSWLVLLLAFSGQWAGSGLSYFLVVLLAGDHIDTQNMRLLLSLVSSIVAALGALLGATLSDSVGRRKMWFWGTMACTISILISGVCTALSKTNQTISNTAIAFLFLFNFFYCATYVPLPAVYASECMTFENRANGVAMYTLVASLASLVNTYATPVALAMIQWRLYFVFIAWNVVACALIWVFAVETAGKTLEELEVVFGSAKKGM